MFRINLLRVSKKHEVLGLNRSEHNAKLPWVDTIESIVNIMKTGNLQKKIHEERDTEVGIVAKFFNHLLVILRDKNAKLTTSNNNLRTKAYYDALTGIHNRRGLYERIKDKILNPNYCLAILDIDKFKLVNDTYGHDVGDEILKELANSVSKKIRQNDIFARWGGEEFILLLKTKDLQVAENIAEKLRIDISKTEFPTVKHITASFGISSFKNSEQSFEEVFKNADKALYQAKENGRNRVFTF